MVNLYCSLLFSRKEAIKFSEAALVSVHCNCLIGWTVIVRGYRPRNTINTIMDICLLVKNITKKKQNVKFGQVFFISHLATLRATLGHWQRDSLTHSMLITNYFKYDPKSTGSIVITLVPTVWPSALVRFEPETLRLWM